MPPPKHISYQSLLNTMRDEKHSLRAEVTKLSIPTSPNSLTDRILLLMDYLQIISSVLFFSLNFETNQDSSLRIAVRYISQIANPASWIRFDSIDSVEITILCLAGLFTILKYLLFGYIILVAGGKVKASPPLIHTWRFLFRMQTRLLYFIASSFWVDMISVFQNSREDWTASQYYSTIFISWVMVALEFLFSLYLNIFHFDVLPSEKLLATKDNTIEILTLVQKLLIQVLAVSLDLRTLSSMWIFTLVNFLTDILKDSYHFGTLPFYNFKALSFQAIFLMIITSLNISCFIESLAKSIDDTSSSLPRLLTTWIILSFLSVKFSLGFIDERLWNVVSNPSITSPTLLIHRMWAIEQIRKMPTLLIHRMWAIEQIRKMATPLSEHQDKNSLSLLVLKTVNLRARDLLKLDSEFQAEGPLDMNNRDICNKMFEHSLRKLNKLFPKNKFIQLCTAQFQIQVLKAIRDPTETLHKLVKSSDRRITLSAELLLMEVQVLLRKKFENPTEDSLDLRKFIYEHIIFAEVKQKVIEQADLQIKICNQVKREAPDLAQIFTDSQKLAVCRKQTIKKIQNMLSQISDYHISPLFFRAKYHLILNHSLHDNLHYLKIYSKKLQKYQKFFDYDKLVTENMFNHDVGFMLFSNSEPNIGKVMYVSKGFAKRVGQDNSSLMTMNILKNVPPCLHQARLQFHKYIAEHGEKVIPENMTRGFVYTKQGYVVELDFYVNIHPFLSSDFCLTCVERAVISNREYIYVLENGEIDSTTQGISQKLGLKPNLSGSSPGTDFHLSDISQELVVINEAFNMVFFDENPDIKPKTKGSVVASEFLDLKEAREIYSIFSTSGRDILLNNSVSYRCKIENQYLGKSLLKLITLEEKSRKFQTGDLSPQDNTRRHYQTELAENDNYNKNNESFDSDNIDPICDERNWADLDTVISPQRSLADYKADRFSAIETTTRGNLLGMMTTSRERENFKDYTEEDKPTTHHHIQRFSESTGGRNIVQQKRSGGLEGFAAAKAASVDTSKLSKLSQQKRVFYLYKISLNTKYTPKIVQMFLYTFWIGLITVLVSQVLMKLILDDNVEDLSVKKDILRCAQSRNYQLINTASSFRILWDINSGTLSTSSLGIYTPILPTYATLIAEGLTEMNDINNQLVLNVSYLSKDMHETFYTKDVRIYENYFDETPDVYDDFDSFQATNRIVETASSILTSEGINISGGETLVHFIIRNCLNSLLLKNGEISDVLLVSLDSQRMKIRQIISGFLITLVVLLFASIVFFMAYSWKQHRKQVMNLSAFCRIHPEKLHDVYENFQSFKASIETDELLRDYHGLEHTSFKKPSTSQQNSNKREYKNPNSTALGKMRIIFTGKFVANTLLMITLVVVTSIISFKHIDATKNLQSQVYSLDYYKSRISLASILFRELTTTNNIAEIEDISVLDRLEAMIDETYKMKRELYLTLMDAQGYLEGSEDFQETLGGEEACEIIDDSYYKYLCLTLKSRGYQPGLALLMTSYNSILKAQVTKYKESNKTKSAFAALENEEFEKTQMVFMVIDYQLNRLADIINDAFEEKIEQTRIQRNNIMTVFILVVLTLTFLSWRFVLSPLKESVNKLKNVLAVLPADLVLASFILRTFLIKTSDGALDAVKNELN